MIPSALPAHTDFQAALVRLGARLPPTPLFPAPDLTQSAGRLLWLKAECLQPTGSFKVRGVLNWLQTASNDQLNAGLITVSAGNHALALAWGAQHYGVPVTVVMPRTASPLKVARTRALGAVVILKDSIQQAVQHCANLCQQRHLTLVHPYNDSRIMAGQGTIALELLAQNKGIGQVLCPVGGGGL
ncbi:MAG: pyridoxal-phosphate dependent enzyme, partial [Halomonadaceae bacterium]